MYVVVVVGRFCIALFSALEHAHCALVASDSKGVTSFSSRGLDLYPSGVLTARMGCCVAGMSTAATALLLCLESISTLQRSGAVSGVWQQHNVESRIEILGPVRPGLKINQ